MHNDQANEVLRRLDILIALTLCQLQHQDAPGDLVDMLGRFDIEPRDIARILGMSPGAVRAARYRARRGNRSARKANKG